MKIGREEIIKLVLSELNNQYVTELGDEMGYSFFILENSYQKIKVSSRLQFGNLLRFQGFLIYLNKLEKEFSSLIHNDLKKFYDEDKSLVIGMVDFYKVNFKFTQQIENQIHLKKYLNEVIKCIEFHEKEVFPKLLDINFLASYVAVPFERKAEISVGGSFPVHLFKKIAILKWGNQEDRYLEYKEKTFELIEEYAIVKPEKYDVVFEMGYNYLIHHLENEPNPFKVVK